MTRIILEGGTFHVAGSFTGRTQTQVMLELIEAGASISSTINDATTALIAGRSCQNARTKAISRHVLILEEEEFLELLASGEVTITRAEAIPSQSDLPETISELRALFDGPPESKTWTRCLTLVEQCEEARREELVHYIAPHVARWDGMEMPMWHPNGKHALMRGAHHFKWFRGAPRDELRAMPPLWLVEMLNGIYSPKHALGRVVNVHHMNTNGAHLIRLLDNPHLTQMTTLVLGEGNAYSKSFFEKLRTHQHSRKLEHLYIDLNAKQARAHFIDVMSKPDHAFDSLQTLHVRIEPYYSINERASIPQLQALLPFADVHIEKGLWESSGWRKTRS